MSLSLRSTLRRRPGEGSSFGAGPARNVAERCDFLAYGLLDRSHVEAKTRLPRIGTRPHKPRVTVRIDEEIRLGRTVRTANEGERRGPAWKAASDPDRVARREMSAAHQVREQHVNVLALERRFRGARKVMTIDGEAVLQDPARLRQAVHLVHLGPGEPSRTLVDEGSERQLHLAVPIQAQHDVRQTLTPARRPRALAHRSQELGVEAAK